MRKRETKRGEGREGERETKTRGRENALWEITK